MRIAIITLPLHTNYGGLLQAYALKHRLELMGHTVDVLDLKDKMPSPAGVKAPFIYMKRWLSSLTKGTEVFRERRYKREFPVVSALTSSFVEEYIRPRVLDSYRDVGSEDYDAFVVGSDQVWRPLYFGRIEDAFLSFTQGWDVRRISYAASFGTDELEYGYTQLEECGRLINEFDAVSVREDSAVRLCSEWLGRDDAVHVADPVMLLDASEYVDIASKASDHPAEGKILTYILDPSDEKKAVVDFMSRVSSMKVFDSSVRPYDRNLPLADRVVPSLEQWIAGFVDADFVVTDSFHGCVMSLLLHKRFIAVGNARRGLARLHSLLDLYGLDSRLVHGIDPEDDGEFFLSDMDWENIDDITRTFRLKSEDFLVRALSEEMKHYE